MNARQEAAQNAARAHDLEIAALKTQDAANAFALAARENHAKAIASGNQFAEHAALQLLEQANAARETAKRFFNLAQA